MIKHDRNFEADKEHLPRCLDYNETRFNGAKKCFGNYMFF